VSPSVTRFCRCDGCGELVTSRDRACVNVGLKPPISNIQSVCTTHPHPPNSFDEQNEEAAGQKGTREADMMT
jgi:hypothetical protein